jgi:hypothetical protein
VDIGKNYFFQEAKRYCPTKCQVLLNGPRVLPRKKKRRKGGKKEKKKSPLILPPIKKRKIHP